jgi:hypothetical protein
MGEGVFPGSTVRLSNLGHPDWEGVFPGSTVGLSNLGHPRSWWGRWRQGVFPGSTVGL